MSDSDRPSALPASAPKEEKAKDAVARGGTLEMVGDLQSSASQPEVVSARTVPRYRADGPLFDEQNQPSYHDGEEVVRWAEVAPLLTALAAQDEQIAALRTSRDEYKALASVGAWHKDCRPNRKKAAEEIQKSQQRIDTLATALADHAQAVQTLATELRKLPLRRSNTGQALLIADRVYAVADRLDALAAQETP